MNTNKKLLRNISDKLTNLGISENEFLYRCGVQINFMSKLRSNALKEPSIESVYKIAQFFKIDIDDLISYHPVKSNPNINYSQEKQLKALYAKYLTLDAKGKNRVNTAISLHLN